MKELITTAANHMLAKQENGEMRPMLELVVVTSEPVYKVQDGKCVRERVTETLRFSLNRGALDSLIEALVIHRGDMPEAILSKKQRVKKPPCSKGSQ